VRARIEQLAESYPQPQQVIEFYYGNERQLQQIEMSVLEDQVIDRVVEKAHITEVPSSFEDIISGKVGPDAPEAEVAEPGDASERSD
jgi:trigger factor